MLTVTDASDNDPEKSSKPANDWRTYGNWQPTLVPWKIREDPLTGGKTKVLALCGPISQYSYGQLNWPQDLHTGEPYFLSDWQEGWVTSPESGTIAVDADHLGPFVGMLEETGIEMPETLMVATGREEGGIHYFFDGRHLAPEDWPAQHSFPWGEIKCNGFVAALGNIHPNGSKYQLLARAPSDDLALWPPEWTKIFDDLYEALGHTRGESWGRSGGGSGRNCELTRLKGRLMREGYFEEDANKAVIEANEAFGEDRCGPLSRQELESTVLRHKDWLYVPPNPGQDEEWHNPLEVTEEDIAAVQKLFPPREDLGDLYKEENLSDLRECKPIRTLAQLKRKLKAEDDDHPNSRDWDSAPEETWDLYETLYGEAFTALAAGAPEARFSWKKYSSEKFSRWKHQLAWLCHGNGAPLIEQVEGDIWRLLKDPESGDRDPYPGWDQGEPVWTKKCIGSKLRQLVYLVRAHFGGKQLTNRDVARVINQPCFRKAFGIEDRRPASEGAVSKAHPWGPRLSRARGGLAR